MSLNTQERSVTELMNADTVRRNILETEQSTKSASASESRRMISDGVAVGVQGIVPHHGPQMLVFSS